MVLPTLVAREEDTSLAYSFGGGSGRNLVGGYFFKFILDYMGGGGILSSLSLYPSYISTTGRPAIIAVL